MVYIYIIYIFKNNPGNTKCSIKGTASLRLKKVSMTMFITDFFKIILYYSAYQIKKIFIYTIDGHKIGEYSNGLICGPGGIAIDKYGYRYVTEYSFQRRLVIFNREGEVVSTSDPLNYPMDVCIDTD